jgi:hypothetical protein
VGSFSPLPWIMALAFSCISVSRCSRYLCAHGVDRVLDIANEDESYWAHQTVMFDVRSISL